MTVQRDEVQQARVNMIKVIRQAVRLRHSIEADNELNEVLPRAQAIFDRAAHTGRLLNPNEVQRALDRSG
jgi:hypothetical protein